MKHKILLVEDSLDTQLIVNATLKRRFSVQTAISASEALAALDHHTYSLIILDIDLPDGNGFQLCSLLKGMERHRETAVIFLSGKSQTADKVMGLTLGADDFISKPIEPLEFQARIDARLRNLEDRERSRDTFSIGNFRVQPASQKVFIDEAGVERALLLTTMEFKLLFYLLRHNDQVLSREQILNEVWGPSANVTDRTVDTHIYMVRQKLGSAAAAYIQAIPRAGYRYSQFEKIRSAS